MKTFTRILKIAVCGLPAAIAMTACQPPPEPPAESPGETTDMMATDTQRAQSAGGATAGAEASAQAVGAIAVCAVCHGADGEGNATLDAPRIGGMEAWYVARQLRYFLEGIRATSDEDVYGTQMRAIVMTLDGDRVIDELADYVESLTPAAPPTTISGNVENGRETYAVCVACHGEDGRGSEQLNTPSLVDQHDWYLVRQLRYYSNGLRGTHREDQFGAQMVPIMSSLSEQDIVDVVAYINTL